jgi:hypothetical protein
VLFRSLPTDEDPRLFTLSLQQIVDTPLR